MQWELTVAAEPTVVMQGGRLRGAIAKFGLPGCIVVAGGSKWWSWRVKGCAKKSKEAGAVIESVRNTVPRRTVCVRGSGSSTEALSHNRKRLGLRPSPFRKTVPRTEGRPRPWPRVKCQAMPSGRDWHNAGGLRPGGGRARVKAGFADHLSKQARKWLARAVRVSSVD